jgi:hypothetical protein
MVENMTMYSDDRKKILKLRNYKKDYKEVGNFSNAYRAKNQ